jgi:hypothetical protein
MHRIVLVILVLSMLLVCLVLDAKRGSARRPDPGPRHDAPSLGAES